MPSGHLVTGLHAALHRQVHLDHLEHAGGQIVARRDLGLLLLEALFKRLALTLQPLGHGLELGIQILVLEANLEPLLAGQIGEVGVIHGQAGLQPFRAGLGGLALDHPAHALEQVVLEDALLVGQVLPDPFELRLLDGQRPRILVHTVTGEHPHVDHRTVHAGRHAEIGRAHV